MVLLFLHLAGAIATFARVAAWFFTALSFRRAQRTSEITAPATVFETAGVAAATGILLVAIRGIAMALSFGSLRQGWIQVGVGAFALMAPVGPLVVSPHLVRPVHQARAKAAPSAGTTIAVTLL